MVSIVIPAHDEEQLIGETLAALVPQISRDTEVVVVCNGCTDLTADVVHAVAPQIRVETIPTASKSMALNRGDELVTSFPRMYLDADVRLSQGSVAALVEALEQGDADVVAPSVHHDISSSSRAVRAYYRIWSRLPSVCDDVVGRGAYALSAQARRSLGPFPSVLGDDHLVRTHFSLARRLVLTGAVSTVRAPRTLRGLLRRKVRAHTGNNEIDRGSREGCRRARRRAREWMVVVREDPRLLPYVPWYVAVSTWPRLVRMARRLRRTEQLWDRDDSSRQRGPAPGNTAAASSDA